MTDLTDEIDRPAGDRDRDESGRARNARPRDELGRPLPRGAVGVPRLVEGVVRTADETVELAQRLLDEHRPFQAHEVFEDAWKASGDRFRPLWKGLAQLAVGVTHAERGNLSGAATLLRRGAATLADFASETPYGLRIAVLGQWAEDRAAELDAAGTAAETDLTAPRLRSEEHLSGQA